MRVCFLLLLACGRNDEAPVYAAPTTAFSLRGTVRINQPPDNVPEQTLTPGRVNIRLYRADTEGYCLEPAATLVADVTQAVPQPDVALLLDQGQTYYISVLMAPGIAFPLAVYPVADWQTTQVRDNACENDVAAGEHYNARGVFRPTGASACCGAVPTAVVIDREGVTLEGVDFALDVRQRSGEVCSDPLQPFDRCQFPGCAAALGDRAALVLQCE